MFAVQGVRAGGGGGPHRQGEGAAPGRARPHRAEGSHQGENSRSTPSGQIRVKFKKLNSPVFKHLSVCSPPPACYRFRSDRLYRPVQSYSPPPLTPPPFFFFPCPRQRSTCTCACDRRALQQLALNVRVKHSDLT